MSDEKIIRSSKRRFFIKKNEKYFQVYSFTQDKDGSIYCSSPDFETTRWLSYAQTKDGLASIVANLPIAGKLSIHGTGMSKIRAHTNSLDHYLIIKGNQLLNTKKNEAGARHLFTAFIKEPSCEPASPAFNRTSDYAIESSVDVKPLVLIFFAVPLGLSVNFQFSLGIEQMDKIPDDFLGGQAFELSHHAIYWFAYRTKHMEKWPKYTHACYDDGYKVPVFIGTEIGKFTIEYRMPSYDVKDNKLTIDCSLREEEEDGRTTNQKTIL